MHTIVRLLVLLSVASLIAACGGPAAEPQTDTEDTQAAIETGIAGTAQAQQPPTAEATTAPPTETVEPTAEPPRAEATEEGDITPEATAPATESAGAETTPETAEGGDEAAPDCGAVYAELLAENEADYSACTIEGEDLQACQRPESLGDTDLNENVNIQLILDSSGSMAGEVTGGQKLDVAQQVLTEFAQTLPEDANVSLRVYGHIGSNEEADRPTSCEGTELLYDWQALNQATFAEAINSFEPTGWTPIAGSLQAAQEDFRVYSDPATNSNFIYLVSDGIETCDGDPVAAARMLNEAEISTVVNVVGFDLDQADPGAEQQLRAVAEAGGGAFYRAETADDLQAVFTEVFNWQAWTQYRTCTTLRSTFFSTRSTMEVNNYVNCMQRTASNEQNAMQRDLNFGSINDDELSACRIEIQNRIDVRYDGIIAEMEQLAGEARGDAEGQTEDVREEAEQAEEEARP